jgi:hypothetical protein
VESQQLAVAMQWPINNNREMVFSSQPVPMAVNATVDVILLLSNNYTTTERQFFYAVCANMLQAGLVSRASHIHVEAS